MGIRQRTSLIMTASFILLMAAFYSISYSYFLKNVKDHEKMHLVSELNDLKESINVETENLNSTSGDWAPWDDTYTFLQNHNKEYVEDNLNEKTLSNLGLDLILYYDNDYNLIESKSFDFNSHDQLNFDSAMAKDINIYKNKLLKINDINECSSGIISFNNKPMLISARPITNSQYSASKAGTLIMGKYINEKVINKLDSILSCKIKLYNSNTNSIPQEVENSLSTAKTTVLPIDNNNISIYTRIKDMNSSPIFYLELNTNRQLYLEGTKSIFFSITIFTASSIILLILILLLMDKSIVKPIIKMSSEVNNIISDDCSIKKLTVAGNNEISSLANDINLMLTKIKSNGRQLKENEKRLQLVLDGLNAGYWDYDVENDRVNSSDKAFEIIGCSKEEIGPHFKLDFWKEISHKDDYDLFLNTFCKLINGFSNNVFLEQRLLMKDGEYKWVFINGSIIEFNEQNKPKRILGVIMDINDKMVSEEKIRYLTYYDKLTGLFNRGYCEYLIDILNTSINRSFSIIMGDVNGLKVINDTFGHEYGDKLLVEAAEVLKANCPSDGATCRWGGDEFVMVLEGSDEKQAEEICENIKKYTFNNSEFSVSIALGYAEKSSPSENIDAVMKKAEERMYRNKLLENKSTRNNSISLLSKTLFEKNHETEEHANRIYFLCEKIGKKLNLSSIQLDELALLAKLHDIGKIGIADEILNKPGKLDNREWEIMKTHTFIGHRIASSVSDLQHIAYEILCHHENFNGSGYPNGLKEEAIPLLSRIISIVDAFDVMTNERPYKKPLSVQAAIEELQRCSGTQFDPQLVKICLEVFNEINITV